MVNSVKLVCPVTVELTVRGPGYQRRHRRWVAMSEGDLMLVLGGVVGVLYELGAISYPVEVDYRVVEE